MKANSVEHYYRASCLGKRALIQSRAWRTANRMTTTYGSRFVAYRCTFCGEWHVGHERKKDREHKERKALHQVSRQEGNRTVQPGGQE